MSVEERMARLEGIMEEMRIQLNHLWAEINRLRSEANTNFRWLLGIQIAMWITIMLVILFT